MSFPKFCLKLFNTAICHDYENELYASLTKSLTEILALGRFLELADQQAAPIEDESINAIEHNKSWKTTTKTKPEIQPPKDKNPGANRSKHPSSQKICRNCGGQYPHDTVCPARGKICNYCKKPNHFKTVCNKLKQKQVQLVSDGKSAEQILMRVMTVTL